jgi:hypothetical protein
MSPENERPALVRWLSMHDALPADFKPGEETPLRDIAPGVWPTVADLRGTLAELSTLRSQKAALVEALKPFAKFADHPFPNAQADAEITGFHILGETTITFGDLRRAATALREAGE